MHRTAVPPQGRTNRTHASPSCALLFPQFLAGSGDQFFVLGGVSSGPMGSAIMFHRLPQQVLVHRAEDLVSQFEAADLGSAQIVNVNACHELSYRLNS